MKRIAGWLMAWLLVATLLPLGARFVTSEDMTNPLVTTAWGEEAAHPHNESTKHCYCGNTEGYSNYCKGSRHSIYDRSWTAVGTAEELKKAFADGKSAYIYLTKDIEVSDTLGFTGNDGNNGAMLHLCLNGYTITQETNEAVIEVGVSNVTSSTPGKNLSRLWICDCAPSAGSIKHAEGMKGDGIGVLGMGTLNLCGGKITGNSTGVTVADCKIKNYNFTTIGYFSMLDGTICGNDYGLTVDASVEGCVEMSGGTIESNARGGVRVGNNAYFTMKGGTISGNGTSGTSGTTGAGVNVGGGAHFEMTDGTISGNTAKFGGGVYVFQNATFTMSGSRAKITQNTATSSAGSMGGGGVCIQGGTFNMSGGTIGGSDGDANTAGSGGGVYVTNNGARNGTFNMTGGIITGNTATNGGGVYMKENQTLNVAGSPIVQGNSSNDVALEWARNCKICVTNPLTGSAKIVIEGTDLTIDGDAGYYDKAVDNTGGTTTLTRPACPHTSKTTVPAQASTCQERGWAEYKKCDNCGKLFDASGKLIDKIPLLSPAGHTFGDWQHDETDHWKQCTVCSTMGEKAAHTGGTETCTAQAVCEICGQPYGSTAAHEYDTAEWGYKSSDGHAHKCKNCDAYDTVKPHTYTEGSDTCEVCAYKRSHVHSLSYVEEVPATCTTAGTKAHYKCAGCSETFEDAAGTTPLTDLTIAATGHDFSAATCTEAGKCSHCDATTPMLGHDYIQKFDDTQHWKECSRCQMIDSENPRADHIFGEVDKCSVCGYTKAVTPGGEEPTPTPTPGGEEPIPTPTPGGHRHHTGGSSATGIDALLTAPDAKSATDYSGGIYGLTFKSYANFSSFQGVQVDGKTIAPANYIAEEGSIEVYLKAVYLRTLAAGKHTVTILSSEGNATAEFTVGGVMTAPKTADAGTLVYLTLALSSYTGTALMVRKNRKES